jgi:hypothetical protein
LRGIVTLSVDFERRAQEHFGRELFYSVPDRFGGPSKAPISQSGTAVCCVQLGGCRIVEGGHEANIALFASDAHTNESICGNPQQVPGGRKALRGSTDFHTLGDRPSVVGAAGRDRRAKSIISQAIQAESLENNPLHIQGGSCSMQAFFGRPALFGSVRPMVKLGASGARRASWRHDPAHACRPIY